MARIRTIKPEFPLSQSIGRLSRDARLAFIELWTIVDDEGRHRAASRMLASLLFPYDDDAPALMERWLCELEEHGFIVRYDVDGSDYLQVVNFLKHQKIDHPSKSKIPPAPEPSPKPREPSRALAPDLVPSTYDQTSSLRSEEFCGDASAPDDLTDRALRAWLTPFVGMEPVALDQDFTPIRLLLEDPKIMRGDVEAGILRAMQQSRQKWRSWNQLAGWIRRAAKDRLAEIPRPNALSDEAGSGRGSPRGPRNSHLAALDASILADHRPETIQ